jgi:hypothetical protein
VSRIIRNQSVSSLTLAAGLVITLLIANARGADPWSFGIMSDTQWTGVGDDGRNPNSVAVDVIQQLNQQFIKAGVKLVVAVGDVTQDGSNAALDTRAAFAQPLYNAGIGFYPLRGNHEGTQAAANVFQRVFPQTQNGRNNSTPPDAYAVPNKDAANQPTPVRAGAPFAVGAGFSSPSSNLNGLSYAFTYNNATFVLLDQFIPADGKASDGTAYNMANNAIASQQTWITKALAGRPANTHAFVFGHKGLINEHHIDTLLGANPNTNAAAYDAFESSLQTHGVRYYFNGHDHMHNRALIMSPDGKSTIEDIICASDSSKFYGPATKPNDALNRETLISQELGTVGYYIVTVDGPRITVDYYSTDHIAVPAMPPSGGESNMDHMSGLSFSKHETFGYDGTNGREFQIAQGAAYAAVDGAVKAGASACGETFKGTTAKILSGANGNAAKGAYDNRPLIKTIDTGWAPSQSASQKSDVLCLWGMHDARDTSTDTFTLSMTYEPAATNGLDLATGSLRLMTKDAGGSWIDAVDANIGGTKHFVLGAWNSNYDLGTYGIDPATNTAWAVVNHASAFVVAIP